MTTTPISTPASPDDICLVCEVTREYHGDKNHRFSDDGQLLPLSKPEAARQLSPGDREKVVAQMSNDQITQLTLRLIELLSAKQIIGGDDLVYLFGGVKRD